MPSFNPFAELFEGTTYPHARTLRNGFFKKLRDAFYVFAGRFGKGINTHIGLLDYFTLGIPLAITEFSKWCMANISKSVVAVIFIIPTTLLRALTYPARYISAAALTIATLPVTLVVDLISSIIARPLKNKLKSMTLEKGFISHNGKYETLHTVGEYMRDVDLSVDSDYFLCKPSGRGHSLAVGKNCRVKVGFFDCASLPNDCENCFENRDHASEITNQDVDGYEAAYKLGFAYYNN